MRCDCDVKPYPSAKRNFHRRRRRRVCRRCLLSPVGLLSLGSRDFTAVVCAHAFARPVANGALSIMCSLRLGVKEPFPFPRSPPINLPLDMNARGGATVRKTMHEISVARTVYNRHML